jgi:homoserine kinase type II
MANYTQLLEKDIQKIASNYPITVKEFEAMEGGAGNSSFRLITDRGKFVLTVFDEKAWDFVTRLSQILAYLAKNSFKTTRVLSQTNGEMLTRHKNKPVMIKEYIDGEVHKKLSNKMLFQAGYSLAQLHQIPIPDFLSTQHPYGRQEFPAVFKNGIDHEYESWLAARFADFEENIPVELPRSIIHGDLFYDNMLFQDEALVALIDFEEACAYYRVFDLGMAIIGQCSDGDSLSLQKARALVEGYQASNLISQNEIEVLQLFVVYAATATSYWRYWKYNIHFPLPEKKTGHWKTVHITDFVRAIPAQKFIEAVFE